ncbi:MAG: hypothetical protein NC177_00870 [Ruminococcus flavefaciens]|nr:hypothetical protein [Ruminococcus flavefaciens]
MYEDFEEIVPYENNLPEKKNWRDLTLGELQSIPNAKVSIQNGHTTIQARTPNSTIKVDIQEGFGKDYTMSVMPTRNSENQEAFEAEVIRRLKMGKTQAQVGWEMGISQSYVSQIKRKY